MKHARTLVLACLGAFAATSAIAQSPFDQFKGRMKEGLYQYKMTMDMGNMPGMPAGMGKRDMSFERCLTAEDIEKGQMGRGTGRTERGPESCEVKDFKMSGDTASYTMVCAKPEGRGDITADNTLTFTSDGFNMDMKMAMNQGGQVMNMTQHMEGKYVGPCKR